MKERDLRNLLLEQSVPGEHTAEERTWDVVRQSFLAREPVPRERHVPWRLLIALAAVGAAVAIGVTAGASIADWTRDKLGRDRVVGVTGDQNVEPVLVAVPSSGQLLVTAPNGVWVVNEDGSKRFVGEYGGATWSPNAQFVAAWNDNELVAVDPTTTDENVHWALARENISAARWSPSGFRIAYLQGASLRVVVGNGADDRQLERRVANVPPAWKPGQEHVLAYSDRQGRVLVVETDTGRVDWRTARAPLPIELAWSTDGQRLIILSPQRLRVFRAERELVAEIRIPRRLYAATGLAPRPGSAEIAYSVYSKRTGQGTVYLYNGRFSRPLFSGAGRFEDLAWSPDGRVLLVPWQAADQWLFIPAEGQARVQANSDIAAQFAPGESDAAASASGFPRVEGWCCVDDEPLPPPAETGAAETGAAETGAETGG
jgi:hypothetical protein